MGYTPPQLEVRKVTGGWSIAPPTLTAGEDIDIYANGTDTTARIKIFGGASIYNYVGAGWAFVIYDGATAGLGLAYETANNHYVIESKIDAKDLYLKTTGTGVIKFGTHTGSGDVACNGSILIKDAAGNARKLMTTA